MPIVDGINATRNVFSLCSLGAKGPIGSYLFIFVYSNVVLCFTTIVRIGPNELFPTFLYIIIFLCNHSTQLTIPFLIALTANNEL
jgi:hypothetical protein